MCGTYGHILSKPGATKQQNRAIEQKRAENCSSYGKPLPPAPLARETEVFIGLPSHRVEPEMMLKQGCTTCGTCKHYINEVTVVSSEYAGWTAGVCAAKGRLILGPYQSAEARGCDFREYGAVQNGSEGKALLESMQYLPLFSESLASIPLTPVASYFKAKAEGFIEPSEYPTDKPVEDGDFAAGIRSWRRFEDPDGSGNAVYFPVYDPATFDDDLRELIPKTGSDEHPELYVDHFGGMYALGVAWMELDETPALWGMPGTGKTELLRYAAWIMQIPFRRISFTASSEIDDVIGKMLFKDGETVFKYGSLPKGWTSPCVLCLDEPNTAPPEIWQRVRPLTDNSKQMVVVENEDEILGRHDDCYMALAMNPPWDVRNIGALEIADADSNRLFHTFVDLPPEELEREIIKERVKLDGWEIADSLLDSVMATAKSLREMADNQSIPLTWAIRQQIKVARALRWYAPVTAYRRAAGDFLEPEVQEILLDQVRANFTIDED